MEKKNILGLGVLLMILVIFGGLGYAIFQNMNGEKIDDDQIITEPRTDIDEDWLNFEYDYVGNNLWRYTVTGTLPNPCYVINTSAIVMESFPEQVVVTSEIESPDPDLICAQVIQEVYEEGEFQASEEAEVRFEIQ